MCSLPLHLGFGIIWAAVVTAAAPDMSMTAMASFCGGLRSWTDAGAELGFLLGGADWTGAALGWAEMVLAMAPLLLLQPLRRSSGPTAPVRTLIFVGLYLAAWMLAWPPLIAAGALLANLARALGLPAFVVTLSVALAWQVSPGKRSVLRLCWNDPGPAATDAQWRSYAVRHALGCVGACGPAMLVAMSLPGRERVALIFLTALLTVERFQGSRRPQPARVGPRPRPASVKETVR